MLSRWPATAAVAAAIVALSELPPSALPSAPPFPHADKLVHVIEYAVLGALLCRSLLHERSGHFGRAAIIAMSVGTLFGALDEWHQTFSGRCADVWDAVADVVGLALGVCLVALVGKRSARRGG